MSDGTILSRTIPEVLADAAARDSGGVWLRTDEGTMTFAAAAAQVAATAQALRDAGVHRGDLVLLTARPTVPCLLRCLALRSLAPVTPSATPPTAPAAP